MINGTLARILALLSIAVAIGTTVAGNRHLTHGPGHGHTVTTAP